MDHNFWLPNRKVGGAPNWHMLITNCSYLCINHYKMFSFVHQKRLMSHYSTQGSIPSSSLWWVPELEVCNQGQIRTLTEFLTKSKMCILVWEKQDEAERLPEHLRRNRFCFQEGAREGQRRWKKNEGDRQPTNCWGHAENGPFSRGQAGPHLSPYYWHEMGVRGPARLH